MLENNHIKNFTTKEETKNTMMLVLVPFSIPNPYVFPTLLAHSSGLTFAGLECDGLTDGLKIKLGLT